MTFFDHFLDDVVPDLFIAGFRIMLRGNDNIGDAASVCPCCIRQSPVIYRPAAGKE